MPNNYQQDFLYFNQKNPPFYFDSAATTLTLKAVFANMKDYATNYGANPHNRSSLLTEPTHKMFNQIRQATADFLQAKHVAEINFVPSATYASNQIVFGLKDEIKAQHNIILSADEHASNLLPWLVLQKTKGFKIKYVAYNSQTHQLDLANLAQIIDENTFAVALATTTNLFGSTFDIKKVGAIIKKQNPQTLFIADASQSMLHYKFNVQADQIDCCYFSTHKAYGPQGIAVFYVTQKLAQKMKPIVVGGGSAYQIREQDEIVWNKPPDIFEAGSPNMLGIFGWYAALQYIQKMQVHKIHNHILTLKKYFDDKYQNILQQNNIIYYNPGTTCCNIIFNVKDMPSEDATNLLAKHARIIVRAGNSCAKMIHHRLHTKYFIRASLGIYTTKSDLDILAQALSQNFWHLLAKYY